jgi:hypothetical protein
MNSPEKRSAIEDVRNNLLSLTAGLAETSRFILLFGSRTHQVINVCDDGFPQYSNSRELVESIGHPKRLRQILDDAVNGRFTPKVDMDCFPETVLIKQAFLTAFNRELKIADELLEKFFPTGNLTEVGGETRPWKR